MRVGEATALVLELHHVLRAGHGISPTPRNSLRDGGCPTWIVAVDSASNTSSLTPIFHPPRKRSACTAVSNYLLSSLKKKKPDRHVGLRSPGQRYEQTQVKN